MPSYGTTKKYATDTIYHVYNRGAAKSTVFLEDTDYTTFLRILGYYLRFPTKRKLAPDKLPEDIQPLCLEEMPVQVQAFCLMPNHYHLQVRLRKLAGLTNLMRRVGVTYASYFREKYDWSGTLFQGCFKALPVRDEDYFLYLSWYIHRNPLELGTPLVELQDYPYSSYKQYLEKEESLGWLDTQSILSYFVSKQRGGFQLREFGSYKFFVEGYNESSENVMGSLGIDIPRDQDMEKVWRKRRQMW